MKRQGLGALLLSALVLTPLQAEDSIDRTALLKATENLEQQQRQLQREIAKLKAILGIESSLEKLQPLVADDSMKPRCRRKTGDAIQAFKDGDYDEAKRLFQQAWEDAPDHHIPNYNLGVLYHKLGKPILAKRFFKAALEMDKDVAAADEIRSYLSGETETASDGHTLSAEEKALRNELINLRKEAQSYMHSQALPLPKRRSATVAVLRQMTKKAEPFPELKKEHLLEVADIYRVFELYDEALTLYDEYEALMEGEVLPDGFHTRRLQLEERQRELSATLASYLGNQPDKKIRRSFQRSKQELEIFASQMDEFVETAKEGDTDFDNITKRLADFRWGQQGGRHVLIVNRFEELLYSNLKGTLPIDRYEDAKGRKFLQNITRLADRMKLKQVEFVEVDLRVNQESIPYVILFTYVPKHESFIILRLPKKDLV